MTARSKAELRAGLERLRLALDTAHSADAAARAEWERENEARLAWERDERVGAGRKSGWQRGTPQCPSCRRILKAAGGWCPSCQTYGGRHDHGR